MATVLLFHHSQGRTPGFLTFADDLRAAGHTVHAPDLYDGRTFRDLREGEVSQAQREASRANAAKLRRANHGSRARERAHPHTSTGELTGS